MKRAHVNGVTLEYDVSGSGDPILLIGTVVAEGYLPLQCQPALKGHRLIRYHRRGLAGSTHSEGMVSMEEHAADAAALLAHLGIARAHVAGHSAGGDVALQLAINRPDVVQSLILLEPAMLDLPSAPALLAKAGPAVAAYASGDSASAMAIFLSAVSGLPWEECRRTIEASVPGATAQVVADADTFFKSELPALQAWSIDASRLSRISQRALSLVGEHTEPVFVEGAERLARSLPHVERREIPGAGHLLHMQRPEAVAGAIAAFVGRKVPA